MFTFLFGHFLDTLTQLVTEAEQAVSSSTDAYALAGVALAVTGVSEAQVYQALPEMNARTVRRVLKGSGDTVRMCMSSAFEGQQVHKDTSSEAVLVEIQQVAEKARVAPAVAVSAVLRYGNAPARVLSVLEGIQSLLGASCKVYNPSGLFTRLMRSGGDVKLPERVVQARQQVEQQKAEVAARPVPEVGMLVKLYGEACRIVGLTRQFAEVETRDGLINVSRDALRLLPMP